MKDPQPGDRALRRPDGIRWDAAGLLPGVVQDRSTGEVLMLGFLDTEALDATLATGFAHFHSRSRGRLWRKGETSGNTLAVHEIRVDCDGDAILVLADPAGPTCHTGRTSCFDRGESVGDRGESWQGFAWIERLWTTIEQRMRERPAGSYTVALVDGGVDAAGRKVVEEATEVLLAAKDDAAVPNGHGARPTASRLAEEMADLLYHMLVLAAERGVPPSAIIDVLRRRRAG